MFEVVLAVLCSCIKKTADGAKHQLFCTTGGHLILKSIFKQTGNCSSTAGTPFCPVTYPRKSRIEVFV